MKTFSTLLLTLGVMCNAFSVEERAKCYKDFKVCWQWRHIHTGVVYGHEELDEQNVDGGFIEMFCFDRSTGLINEVFKTRGLAAHTKDLLCGEIIFGRGLPGPCGYPKWNRNDSSCQEP